MKGFSKIVFLVVFYTLSCFHLVNANLTKLQHIRDTSDQEVASAAKLKVGGQVFYLYELLQNDHQAYSDQHRYIFTNFLALGMDNHGMLIPSHFCAVYPFTMVTNDLVSLLDSLGIIEQKEDRESLDMKLLRTTLVHLGKINNSKKKVYAFPNKYLSFSLKTLKDSILSRADGELDWQKGKTP